jgi:hypothetical protein
MEGEPVYVYAISEIHLDGDGYRQFDLIDIAKSVEKGLEITSRLTARFIKYEGPISHTLLLETMTIDNSYTYIGTKYDLPAGPSESIYDFQGYIIEEFLLK